MEALTLLSPLIEPLAKGLLALILKPSNVKARLNTIEAYCVYYPIYLSIQRLGRRDPKLVEGVLGGLERDPALFVKLLPRIGRAGPSEFASAEDREHFKRNSSLLYLPEPLYRELEAEVEREIGEIASSVKAGDLEGSLRKVEKLFKEKYESGDIQVPGIEDVIEEALILSISALKLKKEGALDYVTLRALVDYYYPVLVMERFLEGLPTVFTSVLSLFLPLAESPSTALERFREAWSALPSAQKLMLNPYVIQQLKRGLDVLGFSYEDFKKAFQEAENLLRAR